MKKGFVSIILLMLTIVSFTSINAKTATIATFADPANDNTTPLFTVNFTEMAINGGWTDTQTGLFLNIPHSGNSFTDAWFEMTEVNILDTFGNTGGGEINFYANGTSADPLLVISFISGYLDSVNFGADEFLAENVTITGSEITGTLSEEEFSFSFTNHAYLEGSEDWDDGFTATAAFTSSAVPEPVTVCILGLGVLTLIRRKNK